MNITVSDLTGQDLAYWVARVNQMHFYRAGELSGEEYGKLVKQIEIKKVFGLN